MNSRPIWLAAAASVLFGAMAQAGEGGPPVGKPMSKAVAVPHWTSLIGSGPAA